MRFGSRLFPYPVLNQAKIVNQYKSTNFALKLEFLSKEESFILHHVYYETDNDNLISYIEKGLVEVLCVVECSETVFRKAYHLSDSPNDIEIPLKDLRDNVVVSAYAYATEDINDFFDTDFLEDYEGTRFQIEKYDVLACDDGFTEKVKYDEQEDSIISSIFLVVKSLDTGNDIVKIEEQKKKIIIFLPDQHYNMYDKMKAISYYQNLYFSLFIIPALVLVIERHRHDEIEDLRYEYNWFSSIEQAYKNIHGYQLTQQIFENIDGFELAQGLMDSPITKSIESIKQLVDIKRGRSEDDE